jgi:hypothetical protein
MFPHAEHPRTPAHGWLSSLRHGLDLIVAFATLRDVDPSPEAGWRDADDPLDRASSTRPVVAVPPATVAAKHLRTAGSARPEVARAAAPVGARPARSAWTAPVGADPCRGTSAAPAGADPCRGTSAAPAGADLGSGPPAAGGRARASRVDHRGDPAATRATHPHRRPLTTPSRTRRPGAVRPEPQPCLTPLVARRSRPTPAPTRGARH